ncbi:hypothetical protein CDV36_010212 [Fusarium kuroshium]|uniref:Phospholipase/carboxylesterase/thioesterase domain-containing protein n=1 Tax=Fusarium kuroshium TaxID=2010991 RepID=A0A3M2RXW4_9HYPO|nr:hypothetical protein CDV36_010212 [Fusarium kuroshium]
MTDDDHQVLDQPEATGFRSVLEPANTPSNSTQGYGPAHVLDHHPDHPHLHTIVFLHGRGSDAEEFAEELMDSSVLSDGRSLQEALPGWRWVFPAARQVWSEVFKEFMPMWFELRDGRDDGDGDSEGLKEAVTHVRGILQEERTRLGDYGKVILGGISQGGAVGMWTVLSLMGEGNVDDDDDPGKWLGGFVGSSTWMPLGDDVEKMLDGDNDGSEFVGHMMRSLSQQQQSTIPVLMGHGIDDAYVDVNLGRQAAHILSRVGCGVDWREYTGAEQEGHWFKVSEQMDHIYEFLKNLEAQ